MWPFSTAKKAGRPQPPVLFTNTLGNRKERFASIKPGIVSLYSCGPTVYGPAHIGNLRAYVFSDLIARVLQSAGYRLKRVINITDVGHLVGDGDQGQDKMAVGAAREGVRPEDIAKLYSDLFVKDIAALGI
ncbi:MAG TPA: class I tRNA ligase family protein, partial [Candidatus Paceibacterota bacterium]